MEVANELPEWTKIWNAHSREIFDHFAFNGYSDATICCDGKRIPVHKIILIAASDYFREILESTTSSHPMIIIENVDLRLLESLLMFIYRGEIIIHSSDTSELFKLAELLKIKGLSGLVGNDALLTYDSKPSGIEVLNVNMFRKHVKPSDAQDRAELLRQIKQLLCVQKIYDGRLKNKSASSSPDHKTNVVKDNKYKSVIRSRSNVYVKEAGDGAVTEPKQEEEICTQLANISLVKNTSKTFNKEAVQDLVQRLKSNLSFFAGDERKDNSDESGQQSTIEDNSEKSGQHSTEEESNSSTSTSSSGGQLSTKEDNNLPSSLSGQQSNTENNSTTFSQEMSPEIALKLSQPGSSKENKLAKLLKEMGAPEGFQFTPNLSSNFWQNRLPKIIEEQRHLKANPPKPLTAPLCCEECGFATLRKNVFHLHRKFHAYEKIKLKYAKIRHARLEEYVMRKRIRNRDNKSGDRKNHEKEDSPDNVISPHTCSGCDVEFDNMNELAVHIAAQKYPDILTTIGSPGNSNVGSTSCVASGTSGVASKSSPSDTSNIVSSTSGVVSGTSGVLLVSVGAVSDTSKIVSGSSKTASNKVSGSSAHKNKSHNKKKNKRTYVCLFCSYRAYDMKSLNSHRKTHTSLNPVTYKLTSNKKEDKVFVNNMVNVHHINRCRKCPYRCASSKLLLKHITSKHPDQDSSGEKTRLRDEKLKKNRFHQL